MRREDVAAQQKKALEYYDKAGIILSEEERGRIEIVDFGLGIVDKMGLQILTYINTERVCAKEMVLLPYQTCAEHKHVPTNGAEGKEETFRCRYGSVYLYVEGEGDKADVKARIPDTALSVFHQIILRPGEQYTIMPETWHWFQAGEDGAIISEFSTKSRDETDIFTDERLKRAPEVEK